MQVVIFCGGQGTRLREETETRPKPMVMIGGYPIVWHIMKTYAHFGHKDFILCLGYKGEMIKEYFLNYRAMTNDFMVRLGDHQTVMYYDQSNEHDLTVTLADTGLDTMTGNRLLKVRKYIRDDTFLVTYGDGLCNVDINQLITFHKAHGKIATVTSARTISRFGMLDIADNGLVKSFAEKPDIDGWINAGYFVFNREIFSYLSDDPNCILEQNPLKKLAEHGQLMAYHHDDFFYAMDTYREYLQLTKLWDEDKAPWAHWRNVPHPVLERAVKEKVDSLKDRTIIA